MDRSSVRAVKFLTPSVEQWKPISGDPYKAHRWSREKRDLSQMIDESWQKIGVSDPVYVSAIACGLEEAETLAHTVTAVTHCASSRDGSPVYVGASILEWGIGGGSSGWGERHQSTGPKVSGR